LLQLKDYIKYGVSPRATLALDKAARAHAFLKGRHFVTPDDVKAVAPSILGHRLILTYHAQADDVSPYTLVRKILETIPCP
jgi:MoxR-like ATPase